MSRRARFLSYRWRHSEGTKEKRNEQFTSILLARKNYSIIEMQECRWKPQMRDNHGIKSFVTSTFPYKRHLSFENVLSRTWTGELFGYVQCDLRVPENLREKFESFPPIIKNRIDSRSDIGDFMKKYAGENKLMTQPRRMLICSFHLINGTIITPLLDFYFILDWNVTEFIALFSTLQWNALLALFIPQWMLGEKVMKNHTGV